METTQVATDGSIKKMWYTHTQAYYAALRNKETMPFATGKDLRGIKAK